MSDKRLYKTAAWERLRRATFQRDRYTCKACGVLCRGRGRHQPVCDHIKAHKGDEALFFDPDNLQTLCKRCHDGDKQQQEVRGFSTAIGVDGYPIDPRHPVNVHHRKSLQ